MTINSLIKNGEEELEPTEEELLQEELNLEIGDDWKTLTCPKCCMDFNLLDCETIKGNIICPNCNRII